MSSPLVLSNNVLWTSPYAFVCFVALREKGIPFEVRALSLQTGEQHREDYAARTLTARVPALEHDGFVVTESMAIVEYLEEAFPETPRVMPKDPKERARVRQILSWIRSDDTLGLRAERSSEKMFYPELRADDAPLSEASQKAVKKLLTLAEGVLPKGKTQLFDAWSIADADLAFFLQRLVINGDAVPASLRDFATVQWERPSVVAWREHERPAYIPYA